VTASDANRFYFSGSHLLPLATSPFPLFSGHFKCLLQEDKDYDHQLSRVLNFVGKVIHGYSQGSEEVTTGLWHWAVLDRHWTLSRNPKNELNTLSTRTSVNTTLGVLGFELFSWVTIKLEDVHARASPIARKQTKCTLGQSSGVHADEAASIMARSLVKERNPVPLLSLF
jgi:hypothetical protein